jgi:hypothetical protein
MFSDKIWLHFILVLTLPELTPNIHVHWVNPPKYSHPVFSIIHTNTEYNHVMFFEEFKFCTCSMNLSWRGRNLFFFWQNLVNTGNSETEMPKTKLGWRVCKWLKNVGDKGLIPNLSHYQRVLQLQIFIIKLWAIFIYSKSNENIQHGKNANTGLKKPSKTLIFHDDRLLFAESVLSATKMSTLIASYNTIMILLSSDAPDIIHNVLSNHIICISHYALTSKLMISANFL